jgi:hypothetical protein
MLAHNTRSDSNFAQETVMQISSMPNISYTERLANQYRSAGTDVVNSRVAQAESVTISAAGQAMNDAISQAINHGEAPQPLRPGEMPPLPEWSFNYAQASQRAEDGLKAAMQQLGIPSGTKVGININQDGTISVDSSSPKNAELEAIVNNNMDLRNSIVAAQNSAYMGRIGDAVSQAQSAMNANPSKADYYNNWLIGTTQSIMGMGFTFDFTDGKLTGSFLSGGQKIGLMENLPKLAV